MPGASPTRARATRSNEGHRKGAGTLGAAGTIAAAFLIPAIAQAHESGINTASYADLTLRMITGLVFVSILAYAGLRWGVARRVKSPSEQTDDLTLVARLPVEPRRSILLIESEGERFLIGASEAGLHPLGRLKGRDAEETEDT